MRDSLVEVDKVSIKRRNEWSGYYKAKEKKKAILLSSGQKKYIYIFNMNRTFKTPGIFMGVFLISKHGSKSLSSLGAN